MSIYGNPVMLGGSGGGGGGGDVPLLTLPQWQALTPAQKKAYGLVAVQNANSGFERGNLYYGADYIDVSEFLPYSDEQYISCFAHYGNFNPASYNWGAGTAPITMSALSSQYQSEEAVYFDSKTGSKKYSIALPSTTSDFTLYCVAKGLSYANGDVIVMGSVYAWGSANLIMIYHRSGTAWMTSIYGADTQLLDTQGGYVAVAIKSASMKANWFAYNGVPRYNVSYNNHGTEFTFGSWGSGNYSTDLAVKFVGMSTIAESNANIEANLAYLATKFGFATS